MDAWLTGLRRGAIPLTLGVLCWILSAWAIEDLHPLLVWLGVILVVLGLVIVFATARTAAAGAVGSRSLAGRPANLSPDGRD